MDWTKISTSLGLKGQTAASLAAFKKRNDDARRRVNTLSSQAQTVDFDHYRSLLGNQAVINEMEGHVKGFKPKTYDVARQMKAIEAFEAQAVKSAQETKEKVDVQVKELEVTLRDIKEVRGFDDLTVVCFSVTLSSSFIHFAWPVELLRDFLPSLPHPRVDGGTRESIC